MYLLKQCSQNKISYYPFIQSFAQMQRQDYFAMTREKWSAVISC